VKEQDKKKGADKDESAARFSKNSSKATARKTALWIGSVVILIFAAVTFIFIPAAAGGMRSQLPVYGYYGRKPVAQTQGSYFVNYLSQNSSQASSRYEMQDQYRQAFDSALMRLFFEAKVTDSGYVVPDKKVDRLMLSYFEDADGNFLPRAYNETPNGTKISIFKSLKDNLTVSRYYEDLFGASGEYIDGYQLYGRKENPKEKAFYKKLGASQRAFDLAAFKVSEYPDREVSAFIDAHKDLFTKYDLSVITAGSESAAKSTLDQLQKNEVTFEDAVKELSNKAYSDDEGTLNDNYRLHFQLKDILTKDEDLAAVTGLAPNALSNVVKTNDGWSLFRAKGASAAPDSADETLVSMAKSYITDNERGTVEDYFIARAKDFAAAATRDGFDNACTAFDVTAVDVPAFALNYKNSPLFSSTSSVSELSGSSSDENFLKGVFALKEGEVSAPYVVGDNVVVLRLKELVDKSDDDSGQGGTILMGDGYGGTRSFSMADFYMQQYEQSALSNTVKKDKKVKDNFDKEFNKFFPGDF
jgi:parvulin-like peptidyl-prolyl isomerase